MPAAGDRTDTTPRRWLVLTGILTAIVVISGARYQIYDTNFYVLWEAAALLAGDHPYRDFYEWGVPLQMLLSAAAQWLAGYRLIGEFALHWAALIAGSVMAFDITYRLSRSAAASLVMLACALALLARTPTFHYPKLLLYPLAIELTWWYMASPGRRRSLWLGAFVAIAFLFRHDHGLFVGGLVAVAMLVTRLGMPAHRSLPALVRDAAAGLAIMALLLAPWALVVHLNEGLPAYVAHRQQLFVEFSTGSTSPFRSLLTMSPAALAPPPVPVQPGRFSLDWNPAGEGGTPAGRAAVERRLGLTPVAAADGRPTYAVDNVNDPRLLELFELTSNTGLDYGSLVTINRRLPEEEPALLWLMQVAMLVPLLALASAAVRAAGHRWRGEAIAITTWRLALIALFLLVVESKLFRERSYVVIIAPLVGALGATFLAWPLQHAAGPRPRRRLVWLTLRTTAAVALLLPTGLAIYARAQGAPIFTPLRLAEHVDGLFDVLLASPPITGMYPRQAALAWTADPIDGAVLVHYVHECTNPGDRLFVTGSTPYQINYYTERSLAGGQLFWHHRWRTGPQAQREQLALLQRQSVPFAFSTADPVFDDLRAYPLLLEHMRQHYVEVPGTRGRLLLDRRRAVNRTWGAMALPCLTPAERPAVSGD